MLAIYKKEMRSYYTSMLGYVFGAFFLLIVGVVFSGISLMSSYSFIGYTLGNLYLTLLFFILIPVITMKALADERRMKTDQLLFTAPIKISSVILGKYLAMVTVFLLPMAVVCLYPIILSNFGNVPYLMSYTAIFGYVLMGCAYLAIGLFISSITESQIIAAVGTFCVLFLSFMMDAVSSLVPSSAVASFAILIVVIVVVAGIFFYMSKSKLSTLIVLIIGEVAVVAAFIVNKSIFEGAVQSIMRKLSIYAQYENFTNGLLDLSSVLYLVSVVVFFVFLTNQSIQKRRWS